MNSTLADAIAELTAELTPVGVQLTAGGYGVDMVCFDDITARCDDTDTESIESLRQDCYHRLTTSRASLPTDDDVADPDEREYGFDILSLLHKGRTGAELRAAEAQMADQLLKDDRAANAEVTVTWSTDFKSLEIKCAITPQAEISDRPFELIIVLDSAGVATLVPQ